MNARIPDRLRIQSERPSTSELLLAINNALRELLSAIKELDARVTVLESAAKKD